MPENTNTGELPKHGLQITIQQIYRILEFSKKNLFFFQCHSAHLFRSTVKLTYLLVVQTPSSVASKASSIPPKASSISSKASATVSTDASITIAVRHTGELVTIVEAVAIVGEVSVGVTVREAVSLGNTHNTQAPELV